LVVVENELIIALGYKTACRYDKLFLFFFVFLFFRRSEKNCELMRKMKSEKQGLMRYEKKQYWMY